MHGVHLSSLSLLALIPLSHPTPHVRRWWSLRALVLIKFCSDLSLSAPGMKLGAGVRPTEGGWSQLHIKQGDGGDVRNGSLSPYFWCPLSPHSLQELNKEAKMTHSWEWSWCQLLKRSQHMSKFSSSQGLDGGQLLLCGTCFNHLEEVGSSDKGSGALSGQIWVKISDHPAGCTSPRHQPWATKGTERKATAFSTESKPTLYVLCLALSSSTDARPSAWPAHVLEGATATDKDTEWMSPSEKHEEGPSKEPDFFPRMGFSERNKKN